jgi:class 3 adenylate cyclase/tetratricopeptide (TPR) repeat protein
MTQDVAGWLRSLKLEQYADAFRSNDIDPETLSALTDADLKEIGVASLGHRKQLLKAIAALGAEASATLAAVNVPASAAVAIAEPTPERRQLTVLFADLVGSTALSQSLDAEDLRDVLKIYQDAVSGAVRDSGGFVAKFMGDGILAYFGYPQAREDAAERAVRAGLTAVETVGRLVQADKRPALAVRVGIATGPVVVGDVIGEGLAREVNVVGETPNLAARLQGLAEPNMVVIGEATARMVAEIFTLRDLGLHELKGIAEPTRSFAVIEERSAADRSRHADTMLLLGRDAELAVLVERWALSRMAQGQIVLISGEGGIGKSQLVDSFRDRIREENATQIVYRCSPYQQTSAFMPIVAHLEQLLQFRADDLADSKYGKLVRLLGACRFPRTHTLTLFSALLSISPSAGAPACPLTPEQQKQHLQHDLIAWLAEEAEQKTLLIVIEDAQWIDQSSLEVFNLLVSQVPTLPILVAITCRPEFRSPWGMRSHLTPIALANLGRSHVDAIANHVAGGKKLPDALLEKIAERTDGVPLFVEEMTKAVLESGVLRDAGDRFELTGPIEAATIPVSLNDALMARLDRLQAAKSLAQLGAVIGRRFSYDVIKTVTAYDDGRLQQELGQLVSAELLYQRGLFPRSTYMFKHALVKDIAYESLLRRRREDLHGIIGDAIEVLEGEQADEQAAILAYHFARSRHRDKAIRYLLQAGDQSTRLHAVAEASTSYGHALALARELADAMESKRLQIEAILKLASVGRSREDMTRDHDNLLLAHTFATELGDERAIARTLYWQARLAYVRGSLQGAIVPAEQSLAIADRLADEALAAPSINLLGRIYTLRWDVARGSELMARSAVQMSKIGNRLEETTAAGFAALAFALHGEPEKAMSFAERGVSLARELADPFAEAAALFYRGTVHDQKGSWAEAIADFGEARKVAEGAGDHFRVYVLKLYEGWTHYKSDSPQAGRIVIEEALQFAEKIGTTFMLALGKSWLALCAASLGDGKSVGLGETALVESEKSGDRLAQALAQRAIVELSVGQEGDQIDPLVQFMNESIRLLKEIEFVPELGRTYASYSRVARGWGNKELALRYREEAASIFKTAEMHRDLANLQL